LWVRKWTSNFHSTGSTDSFQDCYIVHDTCGSGEKLDVICSPLRQASRGDCQLHEAHEHNWFSLNKKKMCNISFSMFKIYLFKSICSKSKNKHKLNHIYIYANVIVKCNSTRPRICQTSVMTDICRTSLKAHYNQGWLSLLSRFFTCSNLDVRSCVNTYKSFLGKECGII
jgi:hypothetical protein